LNSLYLYQITTHNTHYVDYIKMLQYYVYNSTIRDYKTANSFNYY